MQSEKFNNKYRISSIRLQNWDYAWESLYFVTICTKNKEHFFGKIFQEKMHLSPIGTIADVLWYEIKNHFDNIMSDAFIVMPNHIHCIIAITGGPTTGTANAGTANAGTANAGTTVEPTHALALQSPPHALALQSPPHTIQSPQYTIQSPQYTIQSPKTIGQQRFQHQGSHTLSSIIGSYKSAVSKHAHRLGFDFEWQSRFYEHIIRNDTALSNIRNYIQNNPKNWNKDKFHK